MYPSLAAWRSYTFHVANEEIDPGVDADLDDDEIWYSDDPAEEKKVSFQTKIRAFVPVVVLLTAAVFYLPTTVGGKITLSSDAGIETGPQYFLNQTIPCGNAGTFTILNNVVTSSSSNCSGSLTIPVGVTSIAAGSIGNAFYEKSVSGNITLPRGLTQIGAQAFYRAGPGSVVIPSSVSNLTNSVFWESKFSSITFESPSSLTSIGASTFRNMANLTSITLPDEITSVGDLAFATTRLATSPFTSSSRLTNLGTNTFENAQFTSFVIPAGVTSIGNGVFNAPKMTRLTIPNGVTSIHANAFPSAALLDFVCYAGSNSTVLTYPYPSSAVVTNSPANCPDL